jgi:hypothetical protein
MGMDTWAEGGASGGGNVDANTHRLLIGPTSVAGSLEGPWRGAWSMNTYFATTLLAPGFHMETGTLEQIKASNFPAGAFNFASYVGSVDKNANFILDVQEDIERARGENRRAVYALAFSNRRRNALWETGAQPIDLARQYLIVNKPGAAFVALHSLLNLKPDTAYRVGVFVHATSAATSQSLSASFERGKFRVASAPLRTSTAAFVALSTALLRTDAGTPPQFVLRTNAALTGDISDVQLVEDGTTNHFDTRDERAGWRTSQGNASMLPIGVSSANSALAPDFALLVAAVNGQALATWTQSLLFLTGRAQRLCFKVRARLPTNALGVMRVLSAGNVTRTLNFPLSTTWTTQCTDNVLTPSPDSSLQFSSSGVLLDGYLIDDLTLDLDPLHFPPIDMVGP